MGFLFVTTARIAQGTDLRAERRTQLTDLITAEDARVSLATGQVQDLRDQIESLSAQSNDPAEAKLRKQADQVGVVAGTTPVTGPAVMVALDDAPLPADGIPADFAPDDYVVHQQDLQAVVNALWAGGAEALQVMDQRIISTSAVRCVGNTLILQGRVYSPPYTVTAVGPTERMRRALDASPGVDVYRQYAGLVGLGYDVTDIASAKLPGYRGPLELRFAQAVS